VTPENGSRGRNPFLTIIKPSLEFFGHPLVSIALVLKAANLLETPIGPSGGDGPITTFIATYLQNGDDHHDTLAMFWHYVQSRDAKKVPEIQAGSIMKGYDKLP
jgi:hypothetical protein